MCRKLPQLHLASLPLSFHNHTRDQAPGQKGLEPTEKKKSRIISLLGVINPLFKKMSAVARSW